MSAKVERLINLTVALLDARRPMTLAEVRRRVAGYGQGEAESARRMFERDKDDLRRLGVPIRTVALDAFETEFGYLIDRDEYALAPVDLGRDEVTALAVALQIAGDDRARLAFARLAARAPDPAAVPDAHTAVDLHVDALDSLADAFHERRSVSFSYLTAAGDSGERTVEPYGLVHRRGAWYLVGYDRGREDVRAFRIDRMTSTPQPTGEAGAVTVPDGLDLESLVAGPSGEEADVEVAFASDAVWEASRRGGEPVATRDDGWEIVRFTSADADRLLPWILSLGADAEIIAPATLRDRAVAHFGRLAT